MTSTAKAARKRGRLAQRALGRTGPLTTFFRGFLKNPLMVGSIIPSSGRLIRHMLSKVDWSNTRVFVEYGPGVGTFCRPILDRLPADAVLVAIDTNPEFISYLRAEIADPRLKAVHGSAGDVERILQDLDLDKADYILSGLPFSTLPPGAGAAIAAATHAALRVGGSFLVYQYSPKVRSFISPHFARIDHGFEPVNIPPAQLYWAWKDE